jgi:cysteine synthase
VCSDAFARELDTMRALGAELDVLPSDGGLITPPLFVAMRERVQELAARPGAFWTDQFGNPDNRAGYRAMVAPDSGLKYLQVDLYA